MKGNVMELFHFLSAGPHVIKDAPGILQKNMNSIEDLIMNKKFIPFPPRPPKKDLCALQIILKNILLKMVLKIPNSL